MSFIPSNGELGLPEDASEKDRSAALIAAYRAAGIGGGMGDEPPKPEAGEDTGPTLPHGSLPRSRPPGFGKSPNRK